MKLEKKRDCGPASPILFEGEFSTHQKSPTFIVRCYCRYTQRKKKGVTVMVLINVKIQRKSERNYNRSLVIRDLTLKVKLFFVVVKVRCFGKNEKKSR